MAVEQKEQKEVKYIVPTFLRIHLGAHEEAAATGSGHYDARGDDACDAEAGAAEPCGDASAPGDAWGREPFRVRVHRAERQST